MDENKCENKDKDKWNIRIQGINVNDYNNKIKVK